MGEIKDFRNVKIDRTELDRELSDQSSSYLFVSERAVKAEMDYDTAVDDKTKLEARLDGDIRMEAFNDNRKITEKQIVSEIERNSEYALLCKRVITLKAQKKVTSALEKSWKQRSENLLELSRRNRDEMKSLVTDRMSKAA